VGQDDGGHDGISFLPLHYQLKDWVSTG
jgi:hypothetical protein